VGLGTGNDGLEKRQILPLPGLKFRSLGRPAHSQSLHRLRYPGWNVTLRSVVVSNVSEETAASIYTLDSTR
jgi:hypothetical protein